MKTPLYKKLADELSQQIKQGLLSEGDKLPSVRNFSTQKQVSVSTALACYELLQDWDFIFTKPKSGYFVKAQTRHELKVPTAQSELESQPLPVSTSELVMDVLRHSIDTSYISFGAATPANDFPILEQLRKSFANLVRTEKFLGIGYDAGKGCESLRRQLARRASDAGILASPDDVVITAGCQGAIGLCLRALCQRGDIIAVESPGYYGLLQLVESLGLKAIEVPTDPQDGMSIQALQLVMEQWPIKAVLSVPNFSNPLGAKMPDHAKEQLVALLNRHDVPLIEDDIYGELSYEGARPKAVKAFDTEGRVLLCSSASKVLEPQLGLGWVLPGKYMDQIEYERFLSSSSHFCLPQLAVADILSMGRFDKHLRQARDTYRIRRDRLLDLVARYFPEQTRVTQPQGGFVAWLELAGNVDSKSFYQAARKLGIIVAPGELFSCSQDKYKNYIRLSYANEWTKEREEAMKHLGKLAEQMA